MSRLHFAVLAGWFGDIWYRRVGWHWGLRPQWRNLPGGYELVVGPLFVAWGKRAVGLGGDE